MAALALLLPGLVRGQQDKPEAPKSEPLKADPANDQFELALLSYREAREQKDPVRQRETYLAAIRQFDRFHSAFPHHANALKSWYYSAVCYQKVGNLKSYRGCLSQVVTKWKEGPLVGAAAYQLAHEHYTARQYQEAVPLYQLAAAQTDNEKYRQRAIYSRALCFEKLGKRPEMVAALLAVIADEQSPFQEIAERVLAHQYEESGQKEEALAHFIKLANSKDEKTKADAVLRCALLARDLKKQESRRYFQAILVTPGLEEWRGEAQLSLMSEAALAGDHQAVIDYYEQGQFPLDQDPKTRRLKLAASSYEAVGKKDKSTALYKELAKIAPNDMTAFEAGYVVISREYKTGSPNLVNQTEEFLKRFEKEHANDPRIHNARLMQAEGHYKAKRYGPAADAYAAIDLKHIAEENHAGLRYRLANALLEGGKRMAALEAFNDFIEHHPSHPQATSALMKRADAFLAENDIPGAQGEFDRLIAHTGKAQLREYAWAQKANLYKQSFDAEAARVREGGGTGKNSAQMTESLTRFAECHDHLLQDFPERDTTKKAASEFWRGWAFYRLDKFAECLGPFARARTADPGALGRESTLHLALANYQLQNRDDLKKELDALLKNYPNEKVPRQVFAWLGTSFARDEHYPEAWNYLKHAITPEKPAETKVVVWRAAGRSALEAGAYEDALRPLNIVLQVETNLFRKAETNYLIARAHLALKDTERARKAAEACLEFKPQGTLNAEARLLLGDVAMALGDPNTAAQHYVVVVEFYSKEPVIANKALRRAISALELKGGKEALKSAKRYRERLPKSPNAEAEAPGG